MTRFRLRLLATCVALFLLGVPSAAHAAKIVPHIGEDLSSLNLLVYKAGKGEKNRLTVTTTKNTIVFSDPGSKGSIPGCEHKKPHKAICDVESYTDLQIFLGDKNDRVRFKGTENGTTHGTTPRTEATEVDELREPFLGGDESNAEHAFISGGPGNDVLYGTSSHDTISPGPGKDVVDGGEGSDSIAADPDGAVDSLIGGDGVDVIKPTAETSDAPLTIDLAAGTYADGGRTDRLNSVERAEGGQGDDTLEGTEGRDGLSGGAGDDTVDGLGGADYLGGEGLIYEPNADGVDTLNGGPGDDVLDGRENVASKFNPLDKLYCGPGADTIIGRQDDLADASCESSAFGNFNERPESVGARPPRIDADDARSGVQPVSRGPDGAPTYSIACPEDSLITSPCGGTLTLEAPPAAGKAVGAKYGSATFSVPPGTNKNVTVVLNSAGKSAIAQPKALVSVHVSSDEGQGADFGWQQQLGP